MTDQEKIKRLIKALVSYGNPDSYFAIGFLLDHPCGSFANDFEIIPGGDYDRPMPGKLARQTLIELGV